MTTSHGDRKEKLLNLAGKTMRGSRHAALEKKKGKKEGKKDTWHPIESADAHIKKLRKNFEI